MRDLLSRTPTSPEVADQVRDHFEELREWDQAFYQATGVPSHTVCATVFAAGRAPLPIDHDWPDE